jgi:hypothetical protein
MDAERDHSPDATEEAQVRQTDTRVRNEREKYRPYHLYSDNLFTNY